MKLWSTLHSFHDEYLNRDPAKVVAGMTEEMRDDLQHLGPHIAHWLLEAAKTCCKKQQLIGARDGSI
jgi:hypothetical protein